MDIQKVKDMAIQISVAFEKLAKENESLKGQNVLLAQFIAEEIKLKPKTPIDKLGLSAYAVRCLERRDIKYIEQLPKSKKELLRLRGIGEQTADEILDRVKANVE